MVNKLKEIVIPFQASRLTQYNAKVDKIRFSQIMTILVLSLFALKKSGPNEIIEAMNEKEQSLNEYEKTYNREEMTEEEKNKKILHHVIGKFLKLHKITI